MRNTGGLSCAGPTSHFVKALSVFRKQEDRTRGLDQ